MRGAAISSVSLHAGVAVVLVLSHMLGSAPPPPPPYAQVELVQQDSPAVGRTATARSQPTAQQTPAPRQADTPTPPRDAASAPAETPAPPPPPQPSPAAPAKEAVASSSGTGLVTGDHFIPADPETAINAPPAYPGEAAQRGEQGMVAMVIHISPDGRAVSVDITGSSGVPRLDDAARKAVMAWHFHPAEQNGQRVASVLPFNVHYLLPKPGDPLWSGSTE